MTEQYKAYLIEAVETSSGRWRARIRRVDGRKIKNLITGTEREVETTGGMESFSPEAAVAGAKEGIDGGGME